MTLPANDREQKFPIFDIQTLSKTLVDIKARLVNAGMGVLGRDYSKTVRTEQEIAADKNRFSLSIGDREVRHATFQSMIAEPATFYQNTLSYGQDFYTPEDPGAANTAVVDFQDGRCVTGLTANGSKLFHTRLITNYAAYDRVRIIHDATLNGGTIAYSHVGAPTAIPVDTDTVVAAVGAPWYVKVTLTNVGAVSPELRWFVVMTRVNGAPPALNANAFFIGQNLFGVR